MFSDQHIDAAVTVCSLLDALSRSGTAPYAGVEWLSAQSGVSIATGERGLAQLGRQLGAVRQLVTTTRRKQPLTALRALVKSITEPYIEVPRSALEALQDGQITAAQWRLYLRLTYWRHPKHRDVRKSLAEMAEAVPGRHRGTRALPATISRQLTGLVAAGLVERTDRPGQCSLWRPLPAPQKPVQTTLLPPPLLEGSPPPLLEGREFRTTENPTTESQEVPAVGELQVGGGDRASRPAAGQSTAGVAAVIQALPPELAELLPERLPSRAVERIAAELANRTADELADRIGRRWIRRGYADQAERAELRDAVAVLTVLVRHGDCPDMRCEDGELILWDGRTRTCETCAEKATQTAPDAPEAPAAGAAASISVRRLLRDAEHDLHQTAAAVPWRELAAADGPRIRRMIGAADALAYRHPMPGVVWHTPIVHNTSLALAEQPYDASDPGVIAAREQARAALAAALRRRRRPAGQGEA